MGTRGIYGFYKYGIDKITYNHFDSYPEGLGEDIVKFIHNTSILEMNEIFNKIILVNDNTIPTAEQIFECTEYYDNNVSSRTITDWYCLLRKAQGNLETYKSGLKYMIDNKDFIKDSLFCEWGYIINLDKNILEIYKGFQKTPNKNRYFYDGRERDGYYNCKLIKTFPLNNIPENWIELLQNILT